MEITELYYPLFTAACPACGDWNATMGCIPMAHPQAEFLRDLGREQGDIALSDYIEQHGLWDAVVDKPLGCQCAEGSSGR